MARLLRGLSLLSRLGAPSVRPPLSMTGCRFASRGVSPPVTDRSLVHRDRASHRAPRYNRDMSDDDFGPEDVDDVEDKLQAVVDEERRRQRKVKYHILKKKMTPSGAPQRKLTWDAIEQIKYLKREQPEEWTMERLAQGFSVTPDVIHRVLKSKFILPPGRKAKQDTKVLLALGQQVLPPGGGTVQDRLKLPGKHTLAALPPGGGEGAVVPVADRTLMLRGEDSAAKSPVPVTFLPTQSRAGVSEDVHEEDSTSYTNPTAADEVDEESWDGQLLTDEDLEEFMEMEKPRPVVQVGKDFFDAEGTFLYRI
ncbi:neugrin [Centropristis striata]|uniref:neugrin n=1 Tax=Centropristis striata TaxID=184440 RepID=UPI0027E068E4|nr:neugrin [Centropristis striata]